MFNGIVLAIIASLVPLLFYNEEEYVIISFLITSFLFNIYLVWQLNKLKRKGDYK
ncbi:hypothetical protein [Lysinibacillus telephonicus]|uniref:hypothetical protein n=1 Tax=Lysinibacillus telephonicus TaxID=1714840 RepID=UPI00163B4D6E|nr:hypothetical protein [Lysinibacillus telephonicus]